MRCTTVSRARWGHGGGRKTGALAVLLALVAGPAIGILDARPAGAAAPDLVLITIDTLRADATGFGGNRRGTTPNLDRLAAAGRVFTDAHAHSVVTLPSHTNILTGLYPYQHGVRDNSGFKLPPTVETVATMLTRAGYATAAFVGAYPLDSQFGLARGFSVYDDHYPKGSRPDEFVMPERRGDEVVRLARAWWDKARGKPRFLWIHLYDPHAPYSPPEPFATRFKDAPYLGDVASADAYLGPFLDSFLAGHEPPALVVVTADHGEALGEHGEETHGLFAYESTLKVPLLLWGAGVIPGRDPRAARHVDIYPTLLAAAGIVSPAAQPRPGLSLLAPAIVEPSYFEALSTALNRGWAPLRGILRAGQKLIALPLPELYDLPRDPAETSNLVDRERRSAAELRALLPPESTWPPPRDRVPSEQSSALASLGYVAGSAGKTMNWGPNDDPKRLVALDHKIMQLIGLYTTGDLDRAVALGREVVAERPQMPLGHSLLAQALLQAHKESDALVVMEKARTSGVASEPLLRQLGLTLAETGRAREALEVLAPFGQSDDIEGVNAWALALSEAGRQTDAEAALARSLALDADNAPAIELQGLVALRRQRFAEARERSEAALRLNPALPRAWNNLGVALYQLGDVDGALAAWQKAVDHDPRLIDALWNLGLKSLERERYDQARKALEGFVAVAPENRYRDDLARARDILKRFGGPG
ncbi:MAG: sulfatase-like hydrolase/transferase [Acidobacteriota bacterium]